MKLTLGPLAVLILVLAPSAQAAARPDLRVPSLTPAAITAAPGAPLTLTPAVSNTGRARAARSVARVALSTDAKRDRRDTVLARASVGGLARGKRARPTVKVAAPTEAGAYWLLACADDLRRVREAKEANNCRAARLTVATPQPAPAAPGPPAPVTPAPSAPAPASCAATDIPDLQYLDSDCDGIDGTAATSVFVSPYGDDGHAGTMAAPKRTLAAGIAAAIELGRRAVLVSGGQYPGVLQVADGVSLYGGYHASTWQRHENLVSWVQGGPVQGGAAGARAQDVLTPTTLQRLRITAPDAKPGSSYGLLAIHASRLRLERMELSAGTGAKGADGAHGTDGASGHPGVAGKSGNCDSNVAGAGGPGGGSAGFAFGGAGGAGGYGSLKVNGTSGLSGWGAVPGGPGGQTGDPGKAGGPGSDGDGGHPGTTGVGGAGGGIVNGGWQSAAGAAGTDGTPGEGGGGGGGGGGQDVWGYYGGGNGGGGGGEGGHAGTGGTGGTGGGGSFGVFAVGSHGLELVDSTVTASAGGNGGQGGFGGAGGAGAAGALGGKSCLDEVGAGGKGGHGGWGGKGGHGGGGAGGPSYALFGTGGNLSVSNTTLAHGPAGHGGLFGGQPGTAAQRAGV